MCLGDLTQVTFDAKLVIRSFTFGWLKSRHPTPWLASPGMKIRFPPTLSVSPSTREDAMEKTPDPGTRNVSEHLDPLKSSRISGEKGSHQTNDAMYYVRLGWRLREEGRLDESKLAFGDALLVDPVTTDAWYGLGYVARDTGDQAAAADAFYRILQRDPNHANAMYELGTLAEVDGRREAARELYTRTLKIAPHHAGAMSRLEAIQVGGSEMQHAPPVGSRPPPDPVFAKAPDPRGGPQGRVMTLRQRTESHSGLNLFSGGFRYRTKLVVEFRLIQGGTTGGSQGPLPVEMRGDALRGSLNEGDWVQLPRSWRAGRRIDRLTNLTTGQQVRMRGHGKEFRDLSSGDWVKLAFILSITIIIILIVLVGSSGR
jgi:hypothetical protein